MLKLIAMVIIALTTAAVPEPQVQPYWADSTVIEEPAECGACGSWVEGHRSILSYDGMEWVPVCDSCFELFATESLEHRQYAEEQSGRR